MQELTNWKGTGLSVAQDTYNFYHSKILSVIERAFGVFKRRFGIFKRPLELAFIAVPLLVKVAMKLHNYIIEEDGLAAVYAANPDHNEFPGEETPEEEAARKRGERAFPAMGRPVGAGYRSDLERSDHRRELTAQLHAGGFKRPVFPTAAASE